MVFSVKDFALASFMVFMFNLCYCSVDRKKIVSLWALTYLYKLVMVIFQGFL